MNYDSAVRICTPKVREQLLDEFKVKYKPSVVFYYNMYEYLLFRV